MNSAQQNAIRTHRTRQAQRGLARFEVHAPAADRTLIRALARRLADGGPDAVRARTLLEQIIAAEPPTPGGILAALRRSPLVGANLDLRRPREQGRKTDL